MIRPDEIINFLDSVRTAVADDLKPDLQSDHTRASADALVMVLNRMLTDLRHGDEIARQHSDRWWQLSRSLVALGLHNDDAEQSRIGGLLGGLDALQKQVDAVQRDIGSGDGFDALKERLASGDPEMRQWFESTVEAMIALTSASRTIVPDDTQKTGQVEKQDKTAILQDRLNQYLKSRYPTLPENPVISFRLAPGGYAKQTALFSLKPNQVLPEKLVLRLDMADSVTFTSVNDEYPVIEQVFNLGLPVPQPLFLEPDVAILGGSFLVMTEIEDSSPSGPYFPVERRGEMKTGPEFGAEVARVLARLHSGTRLSQVENLPDYHGKVEQSQINWRSAVKSPYSLISDLAYAWLLSHPPAEDRPWCTIHGDFGAHNILVRDGHFSGLIDWELSRIGDPAEDLAQCRMMLLPGIMEWEDFVEEYVAAGGERTACDEKTMGYFCVWVFLSHLSGHAVLREKFLAGQRTDIMAANIVAYYSALITEYLAQSLKIAIDAEKSLPG